MFICFSKQWGVNRWRFTLPPPYVCTRIKWKKTAESAIFFLVAEAWLEQTTFGLWAQRATNCSTPRCFVSAKVRLLFEFANKSRIIFHKKCTNIHNRLINRLIKYKYFYLLIGLIVNKMCFCLWYMRKCLTFAQIIMQCAISLWPYRRQKLN